MSLNQKTNNIATQDDLLPADRGDAYEPEGGTTDIDFDPTTLTAEVPQAPPEKAAGPDPFDPASLRLSSDCTVDLGVKKALLTIPHRKPDKSWWVRTHSDEKYRLSTRVIELKEDRETYLVAPSLWSELAAESTFSARAFYTAINRQGVVFLWPIRLPGPDGKLDDWSRSSMTAANMAAESWVRVSANMALGAYDVYEASGDLGEPEWPDLSFRDLLKTSFKDHYIDDADHTVLRKLRGEI